MVRPLLGVEVARLDVDAVEALGIDREVHRDVAGDGALGDEAAEVLVERVHAELRARLHRRVDLRDLTLADHVGDRRGVDEHLGGDRAAVRLRERQQRLADDALQRVAQLGADLVLLVGGEHVDDAVDALRGALRVQGREHEVAGLGGRQGGRDRLGVAQLADEDHIGVLAQHATQGLGERIGVTTHFALMDQCALGLVVELDRVFDRDDVRRHQLVDDVDHRRESRRLARPGRAGEQHEPARAQREIAGDRRSPQLLERVHPVGDVAQGDRDRPELAVDVRAEASDAGRGVGEVDLAVLQELLALAVAHERERRALHPLLRQRVGVAGHGDEVAVHPEQRRRAGGDVHIRSARARAPSEKRLEVQVFHGRHPSVSTKVSAEICTSNVPSPLCVVVAVMLLSRRGPARSASRNAVACAMSAACALITKSTC